MLGRSFRSKCSICFYHIDLFFSIEMVKLGFKYGPAGARRIYIQRWGEEKAPTVSCISKNMAKFEKHGCIHNQVSSFILYSFLDLSRSWFYPTIVVSICRTSKAQVNPWIDDSGLRQSNHRGLGARARRTSLKQFAAQNGVSKTTVWNMMKELRMKSIKVLEVVFYPVCFWIQWIDPLNEL